MALVACGFGLLVARDARPTLPALALKDAPPSRGASLLSWMFFFFFGTNFIVDDFNSVIVHRSVGKWFLALSELRSRFGTLLA